MSSGGLRDSALWRLGTAVASRSDREIERLLGSAAGQRALFWALAASYEPAVIPGFAGAISFRVLRPATGQDPAVWTVDVHGLRAVASPGAPTGATGVRPTATIQCPLADLVRIALGLCDPAEPMLAGRLTLHGDIEVSSRLVEMFRAAPLRRALG